jgi:small subunit ribosomal protein S16
MAVKIRLARHGSKKRPVYRIVVANSASPRDGRYIEAIGHYNPQTEPSTIVIDEDRLQHWLARGAQPTNTVKQLMGASATPPKEKTEAPAAEAPQAAAEEPAAEEAGSG